MKDGAVGMRPRHTLERGPNDGSAKKNISPKKKQEKKKTPPKKKLKEKELRAEVVTAACPE